MIGVRDNLAPAATAMNEQRDVPAPRLSGRALDELTTRIARGSHENAAQAERTAKAVTDLRAMVQKTLDLATVSNELARSARREADGGVAVMGALASSMRALTALNAAFDRVLEIVTTIQSKSAAIGDISAQSKILSINARIEAASAGAKGKGFAVVAQSMQVLSQESAVAAASIDETVSLGIRAIEEIATTTRKQVAENAVATEAALRSFSEIAAHVAGITENTNRILATSVDQNDLVGDFSSSLRSAADENSRFASDTIQLLTGAVITEVEPRDFHENNSGMTIIDVRTHDEWKRDGRIAGARLVPIGDEFEARVRELDPLAPYLFTCRSGGRSARAARIAQDLGFRRIHNLSGGMLRWIEHRLPIVRG